MKKKINFKSASAIRNSIEKEIDQWVRGDSEKDGDLSEDKIDQNAETQPKVKLYRLSLDIPEYLHRRIKKACATEGVSMKSKLTEVLLKEFPEN